MTTAVGRGFSNCITDSRLFRFCPLFRTPSNTPLELFGDTSFEALLGDDKAVLVDKGSCDSPNAETRHHLSISNLPEPVLLRRSLLQGRFPRL
jgi:hypothetical protein